MIDGPTSAVIVSAVLTFGGSVIVAIIKLVPSRSGGGVETRMAVVETNFRNLSRALDDLRKEIQEMRRELKAIAWPRKRAAE